MQINNITVPDEGITKEYITDPIGGNVYVVTTSVYVQTVSLADFQTKVDVAKRQVVKAQALVDELEAKATELAQATPAEQVISE